MIELVNRLLQYLKTKMAKKNDTSKDNVVYFGNYLNMKFATDGAVVEHKELYPQDQGAIEIGTMLFAYETTKSYDFPDPIDPSKKINRKGFWLNDIGNCKILEESYNTTGTICKISAGCHGTIIYDFINRVQYNEKTCNLTRNITWFKLESVADLDKNFIVGMTGLRYK